MNCFICFIALVFLPSLAPIMRVSAPFSAAPALGRGGGGLLRNLTTKWHPDTPAWLTSGRVDYA
jgi:hypothetical protein